MPIGASHGAASRYCSGFHPAAPVTVWAALPSSNPDIYSGDRRSTASRGSVPPPAALKSAQSSRVYRWSCPDGYTRGWRTRWPAAPVPCRRSPRTFPANGSAGTPARSAPAAAPPPAPDAAPQRYAVPSFVVCCVSSRLCSSFPTAQGYPVSDSPNRLVLLMQ